MDLNELMIFTRVVQTQSFTAAAKLLGMPKSSVSRKVSDLEDRLGARLLQRTTRKLGLTDAGRIYYERCARIVAEVEEADQAVSSTQAAPCGLLRVTAPLAFSMLGPIVAEFLKQHKTVQIELFCSDRTVNLIDEGYDLAIRAGALTDSTLVARSLGAIERVLVAAPSYLRKHKPPRTPQDLEHHVCIAFGAGALPTEWALFSGDRKTAVHVVPRLVVNDLEIVCEVARAGIGIAWVPKFFCKGDLKSGALKQVLSAFCSAATPVHAVYPTTRHLSPKVVAFLDLLRERLSLTQAAEPTG